MGVLEEEEEGEVVVGGCGQDYCSAIIPRPSQRCSHEPGGLWVLLVPTENHGGGGRVASHFFHSLCTSPLRPPPLLSSTKVFIDYLVPLFNNLILGDSALCSHRN